MLNWYGSIELASTTFIADEFVGRTLTAGSFVESSFLSLLFVCISLLARTSAEFRLANDGLATFIELISPLPAPLRILIVDAACLCSFCAVKVLNVFED